MLSLAWDANARNQDYSTFKKNVIFDNKFDKCCWSVSTNKNHTMSQ